MALAGGLVAGRQSVLRAGSRSRRAGLVGAPAAAAAGRAGAAGRRPARGGCWIGAELVFAAAFFGDGAARRLLARRVGDREADGHGVHQRRERVATRSRRTTRGWRGRTSTTTTSATSRWRCVIRVVGRRARPRLQPRVRAAGGAVGGRGVHARRDAVGGGAERLPDVRGGPVAAGLAAVVVCIVLGNLAGVREWLDAANPPGDYDWFAPSRVIPGHDHRVPVVLVPAATCTRTCSRCRSRVALGFVLQVALAGPRGGAVCAAPPRRSPPGWRSASCTRSTRGRIRGGRPAGAGRSRPGCGRPRAPAPVYAVVWLALVLRRERRAHPAVPPHVRPGGARDRVGGERRSFSRFRRRPGAALRALRGAARRRVRGARARDASPLRTLVWSVIAACSAVAARAVGLGGRGRARRAARRGARRAARPPARRARALPVAADRRRAHLPDRPRGGLRARRVRRQRPVPDEHGVQARLPGVAAAGDRRGLRAAVGQRVAAAPRLAAVGGPDRPSAAAGAVYPYAGTYARKDGFARSPSLDGLRWLRRAPPATRPRSTGCGRTPPARPSCSRRSARTTRRSATGVSPRSRAARPCSAGAATRCSGTTSRAPARRTSRALHDHGPRQGA